MTGRHRAEHVELRLLVDRVLADDPYTDPPPPARWDQPTGRRHLTRRGDLPATGWDQAAVPARPPVPPPGEGIRLTPEQQALYDHIAPLLLGPPPAPVATPSAPPSDSETTGSFSLAELGAATGATLLPASLAGPDPEPEALSPWEHSGPLPILPPPRQDTAPSLAWPAALAALVVLVLAAALTVIALAPGGA